MGSNIQKRGENSYLLTVSFGRDSTGKRVRYTKTIKAVDAKAAEKEWIKFSADIERGQFVEPSRLTLKDFSEKWVKEYAENNLAPKTLHRYKLLLDRIIISLGHLKSEKIKPIHLMEFYNNLREDGIRNDNQKGGLSERTILHYHRLLATMLQDATEWQLILT